MLNADVVQFSVFSFTFPSKKKATVFPSKDPDKTEPFCLVNAAFYFIKGHNTALSSRQHS